MIDAFVQGVLKALLLSIIVGIPMMLIKKKGGHKNDDAESKSTSNDTVLRSVDSVQKSIITVKAPQQQSKQSDLSNNIKLSTYNSEDISVSNTISIDVASSKAFCRKCGSKIPPDSLFCHKCGAKVL